MKLSSPAIGCSLLGSFLVWMGSLHSPVHAESVARHWNEENLAAIRIDFPNPPVHAHNLFHTSVAMWDAWAAYDEVAVGYLHREEATAPDVTATRREAISYAAYRVLRHCYGKSVGASSTLAALDTQLIALGYDPSVTTTEGDSPAAVGHRVAATVLAFAASDRSNEELNYTDPDYSPVNQPLLLLRPGTTMFFPNRWQPLAFDVAFSQNGLVADQVQTFIGSHWGAVRSFGMQLEEGAALYFDPGQPPQLGGDDDEDFKIGNVVVIQRSAELDPDSEVSINLSPSARGNNPLGQNDGTGHPVNPETGEPYPTNLVPLGDYGRVIAEFWADGPDSETPPGHWNTLANEVCDHPGFERRFRGVGDPIDPLEWDVKLYFVLNGATHNAAVAVWGCKEHYDYVRPISSIRYMASQGQSSDVRLPAYSPSGLPLIPGLIELVTEKTAAPGERHEGLVSGQIAIKAWGREPEDPDTQYTGAKWIHALNWLPCQRDTFVTPAFAGYVSGHSAFSRAAAEVLTQITGDPYFPEGLGNLHRSPGCLSEVRERPHGRRRTPVGHLLRRGG